jgi:hypothetical protein
MNTTVDFSYWAHFGRDAQPLSSPISGGQQPRLPRFAAAIDDPSVWTGRALQAEK